MCELCCNPSTQHNVDFFVFLKFNDSALLLLSLVFQLLFAPYLVYINQSVVKSNRSVRVTICVSEMFSVYFKMRY
jgi:hypothetical protein